MPKTNCPGCGRAVTFEMHEVQRTLQCAQCQCVFTPMGGRINGPIATTGVGGLIQIQCPNCGKELRLSPSMAGKRGKCPGCRSVLQVPSETSIPATAVEIDAHEAAYQPEIDQLETRPFQPDPDTKSMLHDGSDLSVHVPPVRNATEDTTERTNSASGAIHFHRAQVPDIRLLAGERILSTFEAGMMDLGVAGSLRGDRNCMMLTSHRLFVLRKGFLATRLEIVWLRTVKAVLLGHNIRLPQFLFGAVLAISSAMYAANSFSSLTSAIRAKGSDIGAPVLSFLTGLMFLGFGFLLMLLAREKVMFVSTGTQFRFGIPLTRIHTEESRRFAEDVFSVLNDEVK